MKRLATVLLASAMAAGMTLTAAGQGMYIASTWSPQQVHFLDSNFNSTGAFPIQTSNPNGVTSDGTYIFTGHFINQSVEVYDFAGTLQMSWSDPGLGGLQGLTMVGSYLASAPGGGVVNFWDPFGGGLQYSIPAQGGTVEGLTYDWNANVLYQLETATVYATDPANGNVLFSFANPAQGDPFGGTGIAYNADLDVLAIGSANGNWYEIDKLTGAVLNSGNNGLDMYGLHWIPAPGALALLGLAGLVGTRRRRTN